MARAIAEWLGMAAAPWWVSLGVALFEALVLLAVVLVVVAASTWAERKVSARIQDRLGPTRVGGRFGWLQALADGVKLLCKEDLVPREADRMIFRLAPYVSFCTSFTLFLALPFAYGWVAEHLNAAVFFVLAVAGLEVFGVILGGYASGSKWSLFGSIREASQVVSYEVPMALCVVVPVVVAGTMDLVAIGQMQQGWFWNWFLFHDPFTFITFWVYFTCAVASVNRAPFDLPEAESELVAGFMTEYSGFRWSIFFMAEYGSMLAVSLLAAILFFGGWNGPIPLASLAGLTPENGPAAAFCGATLGAINILSKAALGIIAMMWARWTLPRLRVDQVLATCWKYCVPIAAAMLLGVMLWQFALPGGLFRTRSAAVDPTTFEPHAAAWAHGTAVTARE